MPASPRRPSLVKELSPYVVIPSAAGLWRAKDFSSCEGIAKRYAEERSLGSVPRRPNPGREARARDYARDDIDADARSS